MLESKYNLAVFLALWGEGPRSPKPFLCHSCSQNPTLVRGSVKETPKLFWIVWGLS